MRAGVDTLKVAVERATMRRSMVVVVERTAAKQTLRAGYSVALDKYPSRERFDPQRSRAQWCSFEAAGEFMEVKRWFTGNI